MINFCLSDTTYFSVHEILCDQARNLVSNLQYFVFEIFPMARLIRTKIPILSPTITRSEHSNI